MSSESEEMEDVVSNIVGSLGFGEEKYTYLINKLSSMCCIPLHREPLCYLCPLQSVVPCIRSFPLYSNVVRCIPSYSATFPSPLNHFPLFWCLIAMRVIQEYNKQKLFISRSRCTQDTTRMPECTGHILNRWNDVATSSDYVILFLPHPQFGVDFFKLERYPLPPRSQGYCRPTFS